MTMTNPTELSLEEANQVAGGAVLQIVAAVLTVTAAIDAAREFADGFSSTFDAP